MSSEIVQVIREEVKRDRLRGTLADQTIQQRRDTNQHPVSATNPPQHAIAWVHRHSDRYEEGEPGSWR